MERAYVTRWLNPNLIHTETSNLPVSEIRITESKLGYEIIWREIRYE